MKKRLVGLAVVVASALAAVSLAFAGSTTLKLDAAKTSLAYNKKVLKAKAGKVTIVMTNMSSIFQHDVADQGERRLEEGQDRRQGRHVEGDPDAQARHVHVLLHRPRPRGRGDEGQAGRHQVGLDSDRRTSIY